MQKEETVWDSSFVFTRFFRKQELDTTNMHDGNLLGYCKKVGQISMRILIYGAGVIGEKSMKNEEYKKLSINEFTKAAGRYESNHAGIYEMCKKDYPDILEELEKEPFRDLFDAGRRTCSNDFFIIRKISRPALYRAGSDSCDD